MLANLLLLLFGLYYYQHCFMEKRGGCICCNHYLPWFSFAALWQPKRPTIEACCDANVYLGSNATKMMVAKREWGSSNEVVTAAIGKCWNPIGWGENLGQDLNVFVNNYETGLAIFQRKGCCPSSRTILKCGPQLILFFTSCCHYCQDPSKR